MTSLDHDHDHDTQNTANTNSDGDWDCWDTGDWGDMEQQSSTGPNSTNMTISSHSPKGHHHNDQWTSLEEKPVSYFSTFFFIRKLMANTVLS